MMVRHSSAVGIGTGQLVVPQIIAKCSSSVFRSDVLISVSGNPSKIGDASLGDCTESLHPFVGPSDGKGGSVPVNANTQPGRVLPALRRLYRRAKALHDMVASCWIGDFIGALCLFFLLFAGLFVGCGLGL